MTILHRRLFWKIYGTLLASLVTVAVLMGSLWWLLGETPQERWGAFRIQLTDELIPARDDPPGAIDGAIKRLGEKIGADISVFGNAGELVAASGRPIGLREDLAMRGPRHVMRIDLPDGRVVMARLRPPVTAPGLRILTVMAVVAGSVGLAALPMTARLTRRLEVLRAGMARWGAGETAARVDESGSDEVALVARTFNVAAEQLDKLLASQRALLANASHELRSPLARLRLAIELWTREQAAGTRAEIVRNLEEIDGLVAEILLSSRLDHPSSFVSRTEPVDLLGLAAEEAARVNASCVGAAIEISGNATLLRRLMRNLLENAVHHGRPPVSIEVFGDGTSATVIVSDHGPGIAPQERDRVFEPFYRPVGQSEDGGGWGLGLSLVRQIAERHGGDARCEAREGGGSHFVIRLATGDLAPARGATSVRAGSSGQAILPPHGPALGGRCQPGTDLT